MPDSERTRARNASESRFKRPLVLAVGDAVAPTGFARVMHNILERLEAHYEIHHLGVNYHGEAHDCGWRIYPARETVEEDPYGIARLGRLVETLRPRLVFLLYDLWVLARYADVLERFPDTKCVMYFPVDAGPVEPEVARELGRVDRLVAYTRFGRSQFLKAARLARCNDPGVGEIDAEVIPHGVDTGRFFPLPDVDLESAVPVRSRRARKRLFPQRPDLRDAFIVLNANRNQPRKRIDVTMQAFAHFARGKPANVRLYLHMGLRDAGWDVVALARRLGIEDRLILTTDQPDLPRESDDMLNHIYNACDVGLNTSIGEGWGLVSFEHAATGAPQVVPRHSACAELWPGAAEMVEPRFSLVDEKVMTEGWFVTPRDVAQRLEALYGDPARRRRLARAAYGRAMEERFCWDVIARQWIEVLLTTMKGERDVPTSGQHPQPDPRTGGRGNHRQRVGFPGQVRPDHGQIATQEEHAGHLLGVG